MNISFDQIYASKFSQYCALITLFLIAIPILLMLSNIMIGLLFLILILTRAVLIYQNKKIPRIVLLMIVIVCVMLVFLQVKTTWGRDGGVSFLLLLLPLKSFESHHVRDWQVLLVSSLFLTVASLLFSQEWYIALWVVFCWWLVLVCLSSLDGGKLNFSCKTALGGIVASFPLAMVLFIVLPRPMDPLMRILPTLSESAQTGLSDKVRPGEYSKLVESNEPVFNVIFNKNQKIELKNLYWRTMLLGDFDGEEWKKSPPPSYVAIRTNPAHSIEYDLLIVDWKKHIPTLDYPIDVNRKIAFIAHSLVMAHRHSSQVRRVHLISSLSDRFYAPLTESEQRYYKRLPVDSDPKTRALANTWQHLSSRQKIDAAMNFLAQGNFTYTLNPPLLTGTDDRTDEFLFSTQKGFCEHYASVFAVLMRASNLPARLVGGYQGGTYDESAQFWQIRSKDAHVWVEVWIPEEEVWQRVDPTTVVSARLDGIDYALPVSEKIGGRFPGWMTRWAAKGNFYWQTWVVGFDSQRQDNLFKLLGLSNKNIPSVFILLLLGASIAIFPMIFWWKKSLKKQSHPIANGWIMLKNHFLDESDALSMGPVDFQKILKENHQLDREVDHLITHYTQLRYAQKISKKSDAEQWFKQVKKYCKKHKKASGKNQ